MYEALADDSDTPANTIQGSLQCPPVRYGPRFVRANSYTANGCRYANISGISSIDQHGISIRSRNSRVVVDYALRSFIELLTEARLEVSDIVSAFVYCRDQDVRRAFQQHCRDAGLTFDYLLNHVDICRPDLVFEIEARAARPCTSAAWGVL